MKIILSIFILSMQHAVVPISASASVSSDVREVREQVEHPPEYTWLTCSDVPNFADDEGDGCEWYTSESDDPDILEEGPTFCSYYGGYFGANATGDIANLTANEACCGCGGGFPEYNLCNDFLTYFKEPWEDVDGRNCTFYEETNSCYDEGFTRENDGMTADDACCACGGGVTGQCANVPGFATYDGFDCGWFMQTADDDGIYFDDPYYGYDDEDTRCGYWDLFNETWGLLDGEEVSALDACCVCGGGIRGLDYPSYMPIDSPSTTPTLYPSVHPSATPTAHPSVTPTALASATPTALPTATPSEFPSANPVVPTTGSPVVTVTVTATPVGTTSAGFSLFSIVCNVLPVITIYFILYI